ncbi:MAG: sulfotransferase family protein [Candidatus Helarchaeota archaeon]
MSSETIPIFVVGSGRSGTRMIFKLLSGIPEIEIYHEYLCTHIQQVSAMYYMQLIEKKEAKQKIMELHGAAIHYSEAKYWVDCSNKLSWIIEPLFELFQQAKFVNLIRDGRKVTSSFYNKLGAEMYDDKSVKIMQYWLSNRDSAPMPPPEKKYWWNIPQKGQPFAKEFTKFNRFQRCCYQWREANRVILESFKKIPEKQQLLVKLEELTTNRDVLKRFLDFFEIEYKEHFFEYLQIPQNVFFPMDFKLTDNQLKQFNKIAHDMMETLGYADKEEYRVKY